MHDRSAWWRTSAGLAAWLVLAVTTTGVAWAAVRVVSNQGTDPSPVAVPAVAIPSTSTPGTGGAVGQPRTLEPPSASSSTAPQPSASQSSAEEGNGPATTGPSSRVFASPGGTVSVTCTGLRRIHLVYASPADGWHMSVDSSDSEGIEVDFERGDADLHTRASCEDGSVDGEVKSD